MDKLHPHAPVIAGLVKKLGTLKLLEAIGRAMRRQPPRKQVLSMWKRRGIPWRLRSMMADLARAKGIRIPRRFHDANISTVPR